CRLQRCGLLCPGRLLDSGLQCADRLLQPRGVPRRASLGQDRPGGEREGDKQLWHNFWSWSTAERRYHGFLLLQSEPWVRTGTTGDHGRPADRGKLFQGQYRIVPECQMVSEKNDKLGAFIVKMINNHP